jgi:glycine cleavage system H protein
MRATQLPDHLRYSADHQWVQVVTTADSDSAIVVRTGMTDYAQDTLGAFQFIGLPQEGQRVLATEPYADAEASKAVSDVYAPLSGVVVRVNSAVSDDPSLINRDPYGDGWIVEIRADDAGAVESLLSATGYRLLIGEPDPTFEPTSQAD